MERHQQQQRSVRILALVALLLPVVLGSFPGLHTHHLNSIDTNLPAASHGNGGGDECPFCALSRNLAQVVPGGALVACRSVADADMPSKSYILPSRMAPSDSDPRAPPVHDSIWNV